MSKFEEQARMISTSAFLQHRKLVSASVVCRNFKFKRSGLWLDHSLQSEYDPVSSTIL